MVDNQVDSLSVSLRSEVHELCADLCLDDHPTDSLSGATALQWGHLDHGRPVRHTLHELPAKCLVIRTRESFKQECMAYVG